jgi:hypothetical protein
LYFMWHLRSYCTVIIHSKTLSYQQCMESKMFFKLASSQVDEFANIKIQ